MAVPTSFINQGRDLRKYGYNDKIGFTVGSIVSSYPATIQSGKEIIIDTGKFTISGNMNSPIISIQSSGPVLIENTNRYANIKKHDKTLFINLNTFAQRAVQCGLLKINSANEIITPYNTVKSSIIHNETMYLGLNNIHFNTLPQLFDPLRALNLDMLIQKVYSEYIGRISKDAASATLWNNNENLRQIVKKKFISQEELLDISHPILIKSLSNDIVETYIAVPSNEVNNVKGISGEKLDIKSGNLTINSAEVIFDNDINIVSNKEIKLQTIKDTYVSEECVIEVADITTKVESKHGKISMNAENNIVMIGSTVQAKDRIDLVSDQNILIENLSLYKTTIQKTESSGLFSTSTTTTTVTTCTSQPSNIIADEVNIKNSIDDSKISIIGSNIISNALTFEGNTLETEAFIGVNTITVNKEESGFSSSVHTYKMEETPSINPCIINSTITNCNTNSANINGTIIKGDKIFDNTDDGLKFGPTVKEMHYEQSIESVQPLASSDVGCQGGYEVMCPTYLLVNEIIRTSEIGQITMKSVVMDPLVTKIIGHFIESAHECRKWHTEWAIHHQAIPDEALIVIAIAVGFATQGIGAGIFGEVISAGLSATCATATSSFLRTGDIVQVGKDLTSLENIKSLAVTMVSAGLINHIGAALEINMQPALYNLQDPLQQPTIFDFLKKAAFKSAIETPLGCIIDNNPEKNIKKCIQSLIANTVGAYLSYNVGTAHVDTITHKLLHGGVGAATGYILNPTNKGILSGAIAAMTAEMAIEQLVTSEVIDQIEQEVLNEAEKPLFESEFMQRVHKKLIPYMQTAQVVGAASTLLVGHDPVVGIVTATNAVENNFLPSTMKSLIDYDMGGFEITPEFLDEIRIEVNEIMEELKEFKEFIGNEYDRLQEDLFDYLKGVRYRMQNKVPEQIPFLQTPKNGVWSFAELRKSGGIILNHHGRVGEIRRYLHMGIKRDGRAPFIISSHGNHEFIEFGLHDKIYVDTLCDFQKTVLSLTGNIKINANELAKILKVCPEYKGQHITLLSCDAGKNKDGLAQQLANNMNVPVSAFTTDFATKHYIGNRPMYIFTNDDEGKYGKLKTFYPDPKPQTINKLPKITDIPIIGTGIGKLLSK